MPIEYVNHIPEGFERVTMAGGRMWAVRKNSCWTCEHCTDIFWDWTNGPYRLNCELEYTDGYLIDIEKGVRGECTWYKRGEPHEP